MRELIYPGGYDLSIAFFKMVQSKLHFAAHGHTAAVVIYERADADKPFSFGSNSTCGLLVHQFEIRHTGFLSFLWNVYFFYCPTVYLPYDF